LKTVTDEEFGRPIGGSGARPQAVSSRLARSGRVLLSPRAGWLVVGILMCVAAFLTTHLIGAKSLWLDEAMSARIAQLDPVDGVRATYATPTPGAMALYYLILHFWSAVSRDETWLRMLSAICAVAAIPLVYLLGSRLIGRTAGITAATVVALSPFVVAQGQQARPYALVVLISTVLTLTFYSAMKSGSLRIWLLYAAVATAGMYVHTTVAYLIAAQGGVAGVDLILFRRDSSPTIARRATAAAIIVLASLPLAGQFLVPTSAGLAWIGPSTIRKVQTTMTALTGGTTLLAVTGASILAIPFVGWSWSRRGRGLEFSILIAASVAPIVLELLVSLARPMFIQRYLTMAVPGLALVIASAVELLATWRPTVGTTATTPSSRRSAMVRVAAWAVIVVLSLGSVGAVYGPSPEQWRTAVEMVGAEARPGDAVIVYPDWARVPFDYYASRQPIFREITPVFPSIGWGQYLPDKGPSLETSLSNAKQTGRVWLIYRSGDTVPKDDAKLLASFVSCGTIQSENTFPDVRVVLVDFPATPCHVAK
jgi:mannosyltransferase